MKAIHLLLKLIKVYCLSKKKIQSYKSKRSPCNIFKKLNSNYLIASCLEEEVICVQINNWSGKTYT